jgi:hypothetical protein
VCTGSAVAVAGGCGVAAVAACAVVVVVVDRRRLATGPLRKASGVTPQQAADKPAGTYGFARTRVPSGSVRPLPLSTGGGRKVARTN